MYVQRWTRKCNQSFERTYSRLKRNVRNKRTWFHQGDVTGQRRIDAGDSLRVTWPRPCLPSHSLLRSSSPSNRADELSRSVTFSWKIARRGAPRWRYVTACTKHVVQRKSRGSWDEGSPHKRIRPFWLIFPRVLESSRRYVRSPSDLLQKKEGENVFLIREDLKFEKMLLSSLFGYNLSDVVNRKMLRGLFILCW